MRAGIDRIDEVAKIISKGECILFLGAGAHHAPPETSEFVYRDCERPPLGAALAEQLATGCTFRERYPAEPPTDLRRVSLCYEVDRDRNQLVELLRKEVHDGKKPSPIIRALAEMNFPLIVTTNYDGLMERALFQANKDPVVRVYDPRENVPTEDYYGELTAESPLVFKIHGDIHKPETLVITDEDYIHFVLRMGDRDQFHPIPMAIRFRFSRWPMIFVGYGLLDYNLRLLFRNLRWRTDPASRPPSYSLDVSPDALVQAIYDTRQHIVSFIIEDVWKFVPDLYAHLFGRKLV